MSNEFTPLKYQEIGFKHFLDLPRCGLWADMGMGKTVTALTALDFLFTLGEGAPALVLAPKRVARSVWPQEAREWEHLAGIHVQPIIGTASQRRQALANRAANVFTINYENLPWLADTLGTSWPFQTVIADESTRLKSFRLGGTGGRRARALKPYAHTYVKRWWNLTGTPSPNGLKDLWGQTWFLDRGARLGRTFEAFKQRWFKPAWSGYGVEPMPHASAEIHERVSDIHLSLRASDWFDIEKPIEVPVYVDLPVKARKHYRELEHEMFTELSDTLEIEAFNAASKTIKCLQMANGAIYTGEKRNAWHPVHNEKLDALESIIEEANGAPLLVAYHFKSDLARLKKAFPQGRTLDNEQTEIDWNAGRVPLLFIHPGSGGHGLNLQHGGNRIAFFGHWWNLEEYQQVIERIGPTRQAQAGYSRPVYLYHIIARHTVDHAVIESRQYKIGVQDALKAYMRQGGAA